MGDVPPGRTGAERVGRENDADRDDEVEEGRRAFVAVLAASEGDGRLGISVWCISTEPHVPVSARVGRLWCLFTEIKVGHVWR